MDTLSELPLTKIVTAGVIFLLGLLVARLSSRKVEKMATKKLTQHQAMLLRRLIYFTVFCLFLINALQQLGFNFGVLLGAAGVFTVAISFASQTSVSNLISGIFLLIEQPFKVGDYIQTKGLLGKVHSIDLLSTKIITTDNKLIRIPNESLIKTEITNLNFYKTRRLEFLVGVAYNSDLRLAKHILNSILTNHSATLSTPEPTVDISQFLDSSIELKCCVWLNVADLRTAKTDIHQQIIEEFAKNEIEIPFPQIVVNQA